MLESSTGHTGTAQPPLPSHPIRPRIGLRFEVVMIVLDCLAPSYLADVSVPYSQSTSSAFTKLSVQSGWYLRQKPVGEVRQVVSPPFPFPFPSPPLSIPPKFSDKPVGGKVRSSEREVPRLPPTNTTLDTVNKNSHQHCHFCSFCCSRTNSFTNRGTDTLHPDNLRATVKRSAFDYLKCDILRATTTTTTTTVLLLLLL